MILKRRRFSLLYSPFTAALLFVLVILLGRGAWSAYEKERESQQALEAAVAERDALLARRANLESEVARLSTPRGQEEELREKFGVAKDGERVLVIVSPSQGEKKETEKDLWQRLFDWF